MRIKLNKQQILLHAENYDVERYKDDDLAQKLSGVRARGHMTRDELIAVAKWKWKGGRTGNLASQNTEDEVTEITRASFSAKCERLRIGALLCLSGVQWPMASTILHFVFVDMYPILDWRAMRAIGGTTGYNYEHWMDYRNICVRKAKQEAISMRTLDRALWVLGGRKHPVL